jgi:predicted secreted protein
METFKILLEQTNAKNEVNFKSSLNFRASNESECFLEVADFIVDFVELHTKLKSEKIGLVGSRGITKSGKFHVTLSRGREKAVEFSLKNFGAFVQMNKREKIAEVMGLIYSFVDKHASKRK